MRSLRNIVFFVCSILITFTALAQNPAMSRKQKRNIRSGMATVYKTVTFDSVQWRQSSDGTFEGTFRDAGQQVTTTFDQNGHWLETKQSLDVDALPDHLRLSLLDHYEVRHPSDIGEAYYVESHKNEQYYLITLHSQRPMKFDLLGNPLDDQAMQQRETTP